MFQRLFVFILLTALAAVSFAQDAPKPGEARKAESVYRLALGGAGGYLGVELKEVSNANYQQLGLSSVRGVAVEKVLKDTPAEKAGLEDGDVIVKFNGEAVTSTRKLTRMISEVAPDHTVKLTVVRSGGEIEIPVTMGQRKGLRFVGGDFDFPMRIETPDPLIAPGMPPLPPTPPMAPGVRVFPDADVQVFSYFSGRQIGVGVSPLTKQLGEFFGVEGGKGLLINDVRKDSPAERAGLKAGDVIIEIDGKEARSQMDLMRATGGDKDGPVLLTIVRDRVRQTISVTPEEGKDGDLFKGYEFKTRAKESN